MCVGRYRAIQQQLKTASPRARLFSAQIQPSQGKYHLQKNTHLSWFLKKPKLRQQPMLRSLLTKPRREGDELLAQLQWRQEEKKLHLTQSSSRHFFSAARFFCSSFRLLICCSYSIGATSDMIDDLRIDKLKYLFVLLFSINTKPLKQMVCYQGINTCTPRVWKQDHKSWG